MTSFAKRIAFVLLLLAGGCDYAPTADALAAKSLKEAAAVLEQCLTKQHGIKVRDYLPLYTAVHAVSLCDEQVGMGMVIDLSAQAAKYIVEGQECTKASRTLTGRAYTNIDNDFNKDGEAKFCAWVSQMVTTQNSDLWLRFAR